MTRIILIFLLFFSSVVIAQESNSLGVSERDSTEYSEENKTKVLSPELSLIHPPVGFDSSIYFHGYVNLLKRSAIVLREVVDYGVDEVMLAANNDSYYESRGLTFINKTEFISNHGIKGVYLKMSFKDKQGVDFERFMVYAGNNNNTLVIDIVYPIEFKLEEDMMKCIQSIEYKR